MERTPQVIITNSRTAPRRVLSYVMKMALAALCAVMTAGVAAAQETPPAKEGQPAAEQQAPAPADGLLKVTTPDQSPLTVTDTEIFFTSPGTANYARDIRLSDNLGGLRFFGTNALTGSPTGASIQFFGNGSTNFPGQLFLDSGANNNAALIFRTAGGGPGEQISERMRINAAGRVAVGTTDIQTGTLTVFNAGGAIDAIIADTNANNGFGVFGISRAGAQGVGVYGTTANGPGIAVRGNAGNGTGLAGRFDGPTLVTGNAQFNASGRFEGSLQVIGALTKGSGTFKIDHPLDPENKYLSHSFVESPEMMNIYNGVVTLDAKGEAVVKMPSYFDALNKDFRYQLTCIGGFAPVYVARKVKGNQFKIAGGKRGMEVSWQVTGVRQDAYANANRIKVEENKPAEERGTYLHPEAFGQPAEKGVKRARQQEQDRSLMEEAAGAKVATKRATKR